MKESPLLWSCARKKFVAKKRVSLFVAMLLFGGCSFLNPATPPASKSSEKIKIISTVFPLMEFAQAVVGERGEVKLLLPPGAQIHTWQPRPSDIIKIFEADLFVCIGADLEPWIHGLLESAGSAKLQVLRASDGLSLIEENPHEDGHRHEHDHEPEHGSQDPHIWLDFQLDQIVIDKLVQALSSIRPEDAPFFEAKGKLYKDNLQILDQKFFKQLSNCRQKTFVVGGHAAFGYLARRYGMQQISLYGLNPDSQPTPRGLIEVVEMAREHNIRVIYFEQNVNDDLAKVIAKEIGARTLILNPAANLSRTQLRSGMTFFGIMEMNLKNLREGLSCE